MTVEIDPACLSPAGLFLLAECKTTREVSVDYIKDIVDYAGLIGDAYCGKMFITSAPALAQNFRFLAAVHPHRQSRAMNCLSYRNVFGPS